MLLDSLDSGELDEYRLIRSLGKGAMGQVYLGHDTVLDRSVAIKLLNVASPSAEARVRFLIEARAIARLSHPNVVTVFRVGEHRGTPYLVSEYVRGTSLDRLEKPLSWRRVLDIAIDLARGLSAAHRRGVLHRDIKPANAILGHDDTVKLLDFGLAKLAPTDPLANEDTPMLISSPQRQPTAEDGLAATRESPSNQASLGLGETVASAAAPKFVRGRLPTRAARARRDDGVGWAPATEEQRSHRRSGRANPDELRGSGTSSPELQVAATADGPVPAPLAATADGPDPETLAATADGPVSATFEPSMYTIDEPVVTAVPSFRDPDPALSPRLTATGALLGTPLYMAPEIWQGRDAVPESDLYSLGALLYELACGAPVHVAENAIHLKRLVCYREAPALRDRCDEFDPRLASLIEQCLRIDRDERPGSADEFCQQLESLAAGVRDRIPANENPYRGLHPFVAEHRALFFGRGLDIRAIVDTLRAESLVVVAGDSGVGKSSVCRAGVLPAVLTGELGGQRDYRVYTMVPGRRPMDALLDVLAPLCDTPAATLLDEFRTQPQELGRQVSRALGPRRGVAMFVDQFEELLTQSEREQAEMFSEAIAQLASASAGVMSGVRILVTARGDFLTRLSGLPGLSDALNRGVYVLRPLSADDLRQVVVGPARAMGVSFETDDMVDTLVAEAAAHDSGLPLLSFALRELWHARDRERGVILASALDDIGGVLGALTRHADQVLDGFRPVEQRAAQRLLTAMVSTQATNVRRRRDELLARVDSDEVRPDGDAERALDALVKSRLVLARESDDGDTTYELAHEALARSWHTLREWMDEDREQRAARERLLQAAAEWQRLGRPRDALWRGRHLTEVQAVGLAEAELSERAARFLHASRRFERRRKRLRWTAIVAVPLVIAAVYGFFAGRAYLQRERAIERYLDVAEQAKQAADAERRAYQTQYERALALFDEGEDVQATELWAEVRRHADRVIDAYQVAVTELSAAILVDDRRTVRRPLVETLYAQMRVAESVFQFDRRDAFRDRLLTYDDGTVAARLQAPASLHMATRPSGAQATIHRYRRAGQYRVLESIADALSSPFTLRNLEPGSYLVELRAPGKTLVRYPVLLSPSDQHQANLELPARTSIPQGYIYIPPGTSLYGSDLYDNKNFLDLRAVPLHAVQTEAFLISKFEVTMGEWLTFLRELPTEEQAIRRPQARGGSLALLDDGTYEFRFNALGSHEYNVRMNEPIRFLDRNRRIEQNWLKLPVLSVSWDDARAYARWLDHTGRVPGARLCGDFEWSRAARGADDRRFPHGDELQPDDANYDATYGRQARAFGPDEVGSHPASDSPFNVSDMAGNVWEWVRSDEKSDNGVAYRGGSFLQLSRNSLIFNRNSGAYPTLRAHRIGIRLCADWRSTTEQ